MSPFFSSLCDSPCVRGRESRLSARRKEATAQAERRRREENRAAAKGPRREGKPHGITRGPGLIEPINHVGLLRITGDAGPDRTINAHMREDKRESWLLPGDMTGS